MELSKHARANISKPIAHLHDDVTRAVHYGCSSKDRKSLKKNGGN